MDQVGMRQPRKKCLVCGKDTPVRSIKGKNSKPFCSRICAGEYQRRQKFTGMRSSDYDRNF